MFQKNARKRKILFHKFLGEHMNTHCFLPSSLFFSKEEGEGDESSKKGSRKEGREQVLKNFREKVEGREKTQNL